MGQVCAKNDAGRVATDAPRPAVKRGEKELISSQATGVPALETKFVAAKINFNTDKGIETKADDLAKEQATEWCVTNADWEYTGTWKNQRTADDTGEVSLFEVRKIPVLPQTSALGQETAPSGTKAPDAGASDGQPIVEVKEEISKSDIDNKRSEIVDQKQSFVDMVSEGLQAKVPAERFVDKTDSKEETSAGKPTTEEPTAAQTEEAKSASHEDAKEEEKDNDGPAEEAKAEEDIAKCEYIQKADDAPVDAPVTEKVAASAKEEPEAATEDAKEEDVVAATDAPAAEAEQEQAAATEPARADEEQKDAEPATAQEAADAPAKDTKSPVAEAEAEETKADQEEAKVESAVEQDSAVDIEGLGATEAPVTSDIDGLGARD